MGSSVSICWIQLLLEKFNSVSFLIFCLGDMSILNVVCYSIYYYCIKGYIFYVCQYLIYVFDPAKFEAYVFINVISSFWIKAFIILKWAYWSLHYFLFKLYFVWEKYSYSCFLLPSISTEYHVSSFHFQSICTFQGEVNFL